MNDAFKTALEKARLELALVESEQRRLSQRKAQLLQSIAALAPLVGEAMSNEGVRLADAMRIVMSKAALAYPDTRFTAKKVRELLSDMNFDLSKFKNPLASIHTAMSRMQAMGELSPPLGDLDLGGGHEWLGSRNKAYGEVPDVPNPLGRTLGEMLKPAITPPHGYARGAKNKK
jgi:hypothetical protein